MVKWTDGDDDDKLRSAPLASQAEEIQTTLNSLIEEGPEIVNGVRLQLNDMPAMIYDPQSSAMALVEMRRLDKGESKLVKVTLMMLVPIDVSLNVVEDNVSCAIDNIIDQDQFMDDPVDDTYPIIENVKLLTTKSEEITLEGE